MYVQNEQNNDNTFGDFGRSLRKTISRAVSAPVKAVAKVATVVAKPVVSVAKPVARAATSITKPIARPIFRKVIKPVVKNPMVKVAASLMSPAAALVAVPSLLVDIRSANRQAANAASGGEVQVPDGPLVSIYAPDGSEGQIPSNYIVWQPLVNRSDKSVGTYTEDGVVWTTTAPPVAQQIATSLAPSVYPTKTGQVWGYNSVTGEKTLGWKQADGTIKTGDGIVLLASDTTVPQKIADSLIPALIPAPGTTVTQQIANALTPAPIVPVQAVQVSMTRIFAPDGSEGEIESNQIVNGTYVEDGVIWSTTRPQQQQKAQAQVTQVKMVTIYAPDGSVGEIESDQVVNGKYTEDGVTWTTTAPVLKEGSSMRTSETEEAKTLTFWQKILAALASGGSLSGLGEDPTVSQGIDVITGEPAGASPSSSTSFFSVDSLTKLTNKVAKVKAQAKAARKLKDVVMGKKSSPASVPALSDRSGQGQGSGGLLGLPPAVVYGGATVSVAGLVYLLVKRRGKKKR